MKPTRLWQAKLPAHPAISSLSLARELLGTRVKVQLRDGHIRSKLLLFFYPDDPYDFSYSSGRFFLDVKPPRAASQKAHLRLYWHDFESGRPLKISCVITLK